MNANDKISVHIELGSDYQPSGRLSAAITELQEALLEAHGDGDEVVGHQYKWDTNIKFDGIDGEAKISSPVFKYEAVGGVPQVIQGIWKF